MFIDAHRRAWLGAALLAACRTADVRPAETAGPARQPFGTYELRLCRVRCGAEWPANPIRSGWVVLDSAALQLGAFPDSVRRWLEDSYMFMSLDREGPANGCYLLRADRPDVETYAGIRTGGLTRWDAMGRGDSLSFSLYRSPDAGHEVAAALTAGGFEGRGQSWGAGVAEVDYPDELVLGRYLGPPGRGALRRGRARRAGGVRGVAPRASAAATPVAAA